MGLAVIVDGNVVYGDASELSSMQLADVSQEMTRLSDDVQRLMAALAIVKAEMAAVLAMMGGGQFSSAEEAEQHVRAQEGTV